MRPKNNSQWRVFFFLALFVFLGTGGSKAELLKVFDGISGGPTFVVTGGLPRTFIGEPLNLGGVAGPSVYITGLDVILASQTPQFYNQVVLRVQLWNDVNTNSSPVFSNPASAVQTFDIGAQNLFNNLYPFSFTFSTPILLSSTTNVGITLNWQGDTGSGLTSTDNLTSALRFNAPFAVGSPALSPPNYGYYRNASGGTDFNFLPSDMRTIGGPNSAIALVLYTDTDLPIVPEPSAVVLMVLGAIAMAFMSVRRRPVPITRNEITGKNPEFPRVPNPVSFQACSTRLRSIKFPPQN